jgi:hypothetical protein
VKYVAPLLLAGVCIITLLIFVPTSGFPGAEIYEWDKLYVVGLGVEKAVDQSYWEDAVDGGTEGYEPPPPGPTSPPAAELPDGVKYASGISPEAQGINTEFYNLCTRLAQMNGGDIPNRQALAFYLLSATEQENGKYNLEDPKIGQVFLPYLWGVDQHATEPNIIHDAWANDTKGAKVWWNKDPDANSSSAGPISVLAETLANPSIRTVSGLESEIGLNYDESMSDRTTLGKPGNNTNYYDSLIATGGTVGTIWRDINGDKKSKLAGIAARNPYFFIGYTGLLMNYGPSLIYNKNGSWGAKSGGPSYEYLTVDGAIEWTQMLASDRAVSQIRAWVDKEKPASAGRAFDSSRALWYVILKDSQSQLGNDWFVENYRTDGAAKPYQTGAGAQNEWYEWSPPAINSNKISTPIKLITNAVILEKRYNGEY